MVTVFPIIFNIFLIGTIPGPVLTGYVIDQSCGLWQDFCGQQGSCWVYDRDQMSWRLFVWWCCVKVFSGIMFLISSFLLKDSGKDFEKEVEVHTKKSVENGTTKSDNGYGSGLSNGGYSGDDGGIRKSQENFQKDVESQNETNVESTNLWMIMYRST